MKAALCVCWARLMASRVQSGYCFVWEKLWHPIAIIYGRKYLMFLEEDGRGGMREGERLGLPLVLSTLNLLVDKTGTVLFKVENFV